MSPSGTTINLFDYWVTDNDKDGNEAQVSTESGINAGHALRFGKGGTEGYNSTDPNGWTGSSKVFSGIVKNKLENNYPYLSSDISYGQGGSAESLAYLFNSSTFEGKSAYLGVTGLLYKSDDNYYEYDSQKHYAYYNNDTKSFTVYKSPGIFANSHGGTSLGQFFPFTATDVDGKDVFTTNRNSSSAVLSTNEKIDHYFGLSMSSRFKQPAGGKADDNSDMIFEFRGDDDAWVFIDGVLVGDLGGGHDAATVSINFYSGKVVINKGLYATVGNRQVSLESTTTLKALFEAAGYDTSDWKTDTFNDDTLHTLQFFYLERGGTDSNLQLKFNLATVPVSEVIKVDQDGEPVEGAVFDLYASTDEKPTNSTTYTKVATGTTDANGEVTFTNIADNSILSFDTLYKNEKYRSYRLVETTVPDGYRSAVAGDESSGGTYFRYVLVAELAPGDTEAVKVDGGVIVDANGVDSKDGYIWQNGTYPNRMETIVTDDTVYYYDASKDKTQGDAIKDVDSGTLFAVVFQRKDTTSPISDVGNWTAVTGSALKGYTTYGTGVAGAIAAAQANLFEFDVDASGQRVGEIVNMPGDITKYYLELPSDQKNQALYTTAVYYSTASSIEDATVENTNRVSTANMTRSYSVRVDVTNIKNRLYVQKDDGTGTDDAPVGTTLEGAVFSLYKASQVTMGQDGSVTVNANESAYDTLTTRDLSKDSGDPVTLAGGGVFPDTSDGGKALTEGVYYLKETTAPAGYEVNENWIKVIVDDYGVHVDAGEEDDGVVSFVGPGSLIPSLGQYAFEPSDNDTLSYIKGVPQRGTEAADGSITWEDDPWSSAPENTVMHLKYNDADTTTLEYSTLQGGTAIIYNDEGIVRLHLRQDSVPTGEEGALGAALRTDLGEVDLKNLFGHAQGVLVSDSPKKYTEQEASFSLTKKVTTGAGVELPASDEEFTFTVELFDSISYDRRSGWSGTASGGSYTAIVWDANDNEVRRFSLSPVDEVTLKGGQTLCVYGMEQGYTSWWQTTTYHNAYRITEREPSNGWTLSDIGLASGTSISSSNNHSLPYGSTSSRALIDYVQSDDSAGSYTLSKRNQVRFTNSGSVYGLRVLKQASASGASDATSLAGAEFELLSEWDAAAQTGTRAAGLFTDPTNPTGSAVGATTTLATDADGTLALYGLAANTTYYLRETKAPAGYACLSEPLTLVVGENGTITYNDATLNTTTAPTGVATLSTLTVTDAELAELPYTGILGGRVPPLVGGMLLIGGGAYAVSRARGMSHRVRR